MSSVPSSSPDDHELFDSSVILAHQVNIDQTVKPGDWLTIYRPEAIQCTDQSGNRCQLMVFAEHVGGNTSFTILCDENGGFDPNKARQVCNDLLQMIRDDRDRRIMITEDAWRADLPASPDDYEEFDYEESNMTIRMIWAGVVVVIVTLLIGHLASSDSPKSLPETPKKRSGEDKSKW